MHALALVLVLAQAPERARVDLGSLLAEAVDPATCARLPDPSYSLREVSLQPPGGSESGRKAFVEIEGPAALARIQARGSVGTVRIFLDGAEEALIMLPGGTEDPWRALVDTTSRGWILDLPVPFSKRCRVEGDIAHGGTCEIAYRSYPAGTAVLTVRSEGWKAARPAIARAAEVGRRPYEPLGTETFTFSLSEEFPEGGLTCLDPKIARGPRAITEIHLRAEATDLGRALQSARLGIAFDGERSVHCPLGDFFAIVPGDESHAGRRLEVRPGVDEATGRPGTQLDLVCRFVMPYRERFDLSIDAKGAGDLHVAGLVRTMPWEWNDRTMRFHAAWKASGPALDGPWLRIEGSGFLVGESVSIGAGRGQVARARERLRADGGAVLDTLLDFGGVSPDWVIARGFRESDRIPFQSSLESSAELRLDPERPFRLASTVYYYALPGARVDEAK